MTGDIQLAEQTLKRQGIGMLIGLTIEYLLGMYSNLYVQFPQGKYGGALWEFSWKQIPLAMHIIIGFLLLFGTVVLLIRSIMNKNKTWIIASIVGVLSIFAAVAGGSLFIPTQTNTYSFVMAIAFLVAFFSFGWGVYASR